MSLEVSIRRDPQSLGSHHERKFHCNLFTISAIDKLFRGNAPKADVEASMVKSNYITDAMCGLCPVQFLFSIPTTFLCPLFTTFPVNFLFPPPSLRYFVSQLPPGVLNPWLTFDSVSRTKTQNVHLYHRHCRPRRPRCLCQPRQEGLRRPSYLLRHRSWSLW